MLLSAIALAVFAAAPADTTVNDTSEAAPASRPILISLSPLNALLGSPGLEIEVALDVGVSAFVAPAITFGGSSDFDVRPRWGFDAGLRVFPYGQAPLGLWLGPQVGGYTPLSSQRWAWYAGALVGFTWATPEGIAISGGGGAQWAVIPPGYPGVGQTAQQGWRGLVPAARVNVGWNF